MPSLHSFCLLNDPGTSPCGPTRYGMPPSLGTVGDKLSFQWPSSPDLLSSPYLTNKKTYSLKERDMGKFQYKSIYTSNTQPPIFCCIWIALFCLQNISCTSSFGCLNYISNCLHFRDKIWRYLTSGKITERNTYFLWGRVWGMGKECRAQALVWF